MRLTSPHTVSVSFLVLCILCLCVAVTDVGDCSSLVICWSLKKCSSLYLVQNKNWLVGLVSIIFCSVCVCLQLRDARGTTHIWILGQWNLAMDMASSIVHHFNFRVLQQHHYLEKHWTLDYSYCTWENFTSSPLLYMKRNLILPFSCGSVHYHFYPSSSVHFSSTECCHVLSDVLINMFEL